MSLPWYRDQFPGGAWWFRRDLAAIRTFNRYELKYLLDRSAVARVRPELSFRLDADPYGDAGSYLVWSRYYDTYDLRCYWEKIDGIKFRRKLRIRHYGAPHALHRRRPGVGRDQAAPQPGHAKAAGPAAATPGDRVVRAGAISTVRPARRSRRRRGRSAS